MKRSRTRLALPAGLLLLVAATHHPRARVATPAAVVPTPALRGTFFYSPQGSDDIQQAIRAGTARMGFLARPIARARLEKANIPARWVRIESGPTQVSIATDRYAAIVTPADGRSIKWKRENGEPVDVNSVWEQGKLKETFVAHDGSRENVFWLTPDGQTLIMQVTMRSPRLPAPIVYKLNFKRKA